MLLVRAVREEALAVNASAVNHAAALIYEAGYGKYVGYVVVEVRVLKSELTPPPPFSMTCLYPADEAHGVLLHS